MQILDKNKNFHIQMNFSSWVLNNRFDNLNFYCVFNNMASIPEIDITAPKREVGMLSNCGI